MSISVTSNADGSTTVTCGADSVTIGSAPKPKDAPPPEIPILWPNGGATASIIAAGNARLKTVRVPAGKPLAEAIKAQHDLHAKHARPTLFEFHVEGSEPLQVGEVNRALKRLGNPQWMGTQIKLTGPSDG